MRDPATGEYSGFFAELCRELATTLDVKPEFVDTTWDNIVVGLQAGKWDVSLALNRTPARAMAVNVSVPAMAYRISLACNKENPKIPANPVSVADIDVAGVTLAVMSGTAQDRAISAQIKNATVLRLPTNDETRLAVVSPPRIRDPCGSMTFPDPGHLLDAFPGQASLDRPLCDHPLKGFGLGQADRALLRPSRRACRAARGRGECSIISPRP